MAYIKISVYLALHNNSFFDDFCTNINKVSKNNNIVIADILLIILAFLGILIATIVDLKTREIPNWINFSMVAVALAIRLMHSVLTAEWFYILYGLLGFASMFLLGNLMYYTKQWGGGDSKLLFALGAIFATKPYFIKNYPIPFLAVLFLAIIITGFFYSFFYSIVLAIINRKEFWKEIKHRMNLHRKLRFLLTTLAVLIAISSLFVIYYLKPLILSISAIIVFSTYWILFTKAVESSCLTKKVSISKITEGEWIVDENILNKFKISKLGITNQQIKALKQAKIKEVLIKQGIPFAPAFLIALIILVSL